MAATPFPYLDIRSGKVERPFYCYGCVLELNNMEDFPLNIVHSPDVVAFRERFLCLRRSRERAFLKTEILSHFESCQKAIEYWQSAQTQ
jgi:hypothetical protein